MAFCNSCVRNEITQNNRCGWKWEILLIARVFAMVILDKIPQTSLLLACGTTWQPQCMHGAFSGAISNDKGNIFQPFQKNVLKTVLPGHFCVCSQFLLAVFMWLTYRWLDSFPSRIRLGHYTQDINQEHLSSQIEQSAEGTAWGNLYIPLKFLHGELTYLQFFGHIIDCDRRRLEEQSVA